jgi:hypothetical protein
MVKISLLYRGVQGRSAMTAMLGERVIKMHLGKKWRKIPKFGLTVVAKKYSRVLLQLS